jgi:opacity protein-like surface antigen
MNKFLIVFALIAALFTTSVQADSDVRLVYDNGNFAVEVDKHYGYRDYSYHRDQYNGYYNGLYNNQRIPRYYYDQRYYQPYGYYNNYPRYNRQYRYNYNYRFDNRREYRHHRRHRDR